MVEVISKGDTLENKYRLNRIDTKKQKPKRKERKTYVLIIDQKDKGYKKRNIGGKS